MENSYINPIIEKFVYLVITIIYIVIIFIIFFNSMYSLVLSIKTKKKFMTRIHFTGFSDYIYNSSKIVLEEAISFSLSLILATEILRLLYIKTFRNLLFIACIIILKLVLNYFVRKDLEEEYKKNKYNL